jgi:hypothetical protein
VENVFTVLQGDRRSPHRFWLRNKPLAYFVEESRVLGFLLTEKAKAFSAITIAHHLS